MSNLARAKKIIGHELVRKIFQTLIMRFITTFLMAVASLFIIKQLTVHENGSYSYLNSLVTIGIQLISAGFAAGIIYFGSYKQGWVVKKILKYGFIAVLIAAPLFFFVGKDYLYLSWLLSLIFVLTALGSYGNSLFLSQKAVWISNVADGLQSMFFVAAIFILYLSGRGSVFLVLISLAASLLIKVGFYLMFLSKSIVTNLLNSKTTNKIDDNSYAILIRATSVNVLTFLVLRTTVIILKFYQGETAVGIYSLATNVADLFILIPGVISTISFPYFAEAIATGKKINKWQLFIGSLALSALLSGMFYIFGRYIVMFVGGDRYIDSLIPLKILGLGVFFLSIQLILAQEVIAHSFPRQMVYVWIVGFVSNIGLNILLVPGMSYVGSAIAASVSYALISIYVAYLFFLNRADNKNEGLTDVG
jgi:O-antigen/teichoic acid export membrane protein